MKGIPSWSRVSMKRSTRTRTVSALMVNTRRRVPQPGGSPIYSRPRVDPESRTNARRHAQLFVSGLIFISLVGTVFLALPWVTSSGQPTPLVDAFFTSVSAATVTGLSVVDTLEHWNWSGQFVILVLTQTGGLGFMVGASILLQMLRRGAGAYTLRDELLLRDGAPALSIQEAVFLAGRIVRFTFVVEIIGAAALAIWFGTAGGLRPLNALWNGLFYAVAAFCNAGFDLTGSYQSIRPAATDVWVNLVLIGLIQFGALSYMVFADVAQKRSWRSLVLDSKIVLTLNGVLLAAGTIVFLAAEWGGALAAYAPESKLLASLFQSVSARSAGFSSIDWALVNPLTLFFWQRRIATPLIFRAVTVIALFLMIFGMGVVALSIAEHHVGDRETGMFNLMFEAMSALATAGLSTGITPTLTTAGKLILCALMLVGHLGPLITVYALQRRQHRERYRFPVEAVRIG